MASWTEDWSFFRIDFELSAEATGGSRLTVPIHCRRDVDSGTTTDRSQEGVVVENGPSLGELAVRDPPKNDPPHLNSSTSRFDAKEGTIVGPGPTGKHSDHVAACDALFLSHLDVREPRPHHREPTLRALRTWWRPWRSGVVDEVWSQITISGAEIAPVYEVLVVAPYQFSV